MCYGTEGIKLEGSGGAGAIYEGLVETLCVCDETKGPAEWVRVARWASMLRVTEARRFMHAVAVKSLNEGLVHTVALPENPRYWDLNGHLSE